MRGITIALILSMLFFACKQSNKQIDEQQLLGNWQTIEGFNFEEIAFSIEDDSRVVNLVFGQRASLGRWIVENGSLIVMGPFDTLTFTEIQFSADTLFLIQKSGANSVFIRQKIEPCKAPSLLKTLKDKSNINFSEIADTIMENGIEAYYISIPVEVTEDFSVLGKTIAPLVNELPSMGFELDNELITEVQTGYFHNEYRLIVTNRYKSPIPKTSITKNDSDDSSGIYEIIIICYCN